MELNIEKGQTVLDVKHQFVEKYPGLKIELFKKAHDHNESSSAKMRVLGTESIEDLVECDMPCTIGISRAMKVSEVEEEFEKTAGLHVQIFRKMRGVWIETVQTDSLTLEEQMELSANSTKL